jgi:2-oxoglutarate ferredoxin oxidoreductase subunit alpha
MTESMLWKIGGPAGQGIMTTGLSMSKLAARAGAYVFDYNEYPSLVQGGHNTYEVYFSTKERTASALPVDILICLNQETLANHEHRLAVQSRVMYDPAQFEPTSASETLQSQLVAVPFKEIVANQRASSIMANTVALGAGWALVGGSERFLQTLISEQFARKGDEVIQQNIACAMAGYAHVTNNFAGLIRPFPWLSNLPEQALMTGNDAFSLGAVAAQCMLYASYPMTPSSTVLATLAAWQNATGMVVRHAEDEIGVISEALGASFAGVRAAVGTSGGGFALMTESISYAGVAEIPIVIFLSQRPGPATGMPTWTEQGDLLFAVHGGHGEFPKIVLAPGDVEEMLLMTQQAFDLADIYQLPVVLLSDKLLSESHKGVPMTEIQAATRTVPNRGELLSQTPKNYTRYAVTDTGISPRLLPGTPGAFYQANSYEHLEDSHTTENAAERIAQNLKRARKIETYMKTHWQPPAVYGDLDTAEVTFVSWGSTKGAIAQARSLLTIPTAHIHFTHASHFDEQRLQPLFSHQTRYILVENNMTAQFGALLRMHTGIHLSDTILKYDGRPLYPEDILKGVNA